MKLDLNLLKRLYSIDHPSKHEWDMLSLIINECYKIQNLHFEIDGYCNIFITKNTSNPDFYPCVICHTDCVIPCSNKEVKIKNNKIWGKDKSTGKQVALGADDANGICCALQLLKAVPDLKVCFTTEEEIGFTGADYATDNVDFFYNVSYMIQADRHGGSDLITYTNGIYSASELWLQEISGLMAKYKYTEAFGIGTDVGVLTEKLEISGVNISCGYYFEHRNDEYTLISELQNCLDFMLDIINTVPIDQQYTVKIDYKPYNYFKDIEPECFDKTENRKEAHLDDYPKENDYFRDDPYYACAYCKNYDCMNCKIYPM